MLIYGQYGIIYNLTELDHKIVKQILHTQVILYISVYLVSNCNKNKFYHCETCALVSNAFP